MSGPMNVSPKEVFLLYQSFGMPKELIKEEFQKNPLSFPEKEFQKELEKHQKLSRTATKGKFSAGLADHSDMVKKYHTATHLLHKALKIILGDEVQQMGSNITKERLRFDFNFSRKLTKEEIDKIENLMNKTIKENLPINHKEISYTEAVKSGALSYFRDRYPKIVKVYTIGDFSKEICTGPHVKNTKDLGKFKIIKEESSSSGVRRIKAVLE
jgi:alanyl-tRNA synthetase